jgi:hypothetical protein
MLFSMGNGLEEDALVDIPNTLTLPQLTLIMSLFTVLISWLVIFAYLALRPTPPDQHVEQAEHAKTLPVTTSPVIQNFPITPRAPSIYPITQPTPIVNVSADSAREVVLDGSRQSYH